MGSNMAGYDGYSQSNNALAAKAEGRWPLSHAVRIVAENLGIRRAAARVALEWFGACERHHTSKEFNLTDFFNTTDRTMLILARLVNSVRKPLDLDRDALENFESRARQIESALDAMGWVRRAFLSAEERLEAERAFGEACAAVETARIFCAIFCETQNAADKALDEKKAEHRRLRRGGMATTEEIAAAEKALRDALDANDVAWSRAGMAYRLLNELEEKKVAAAARLGL
jgi:hypothetical protein